MTFRVRERNYIEGDDSGGQITEMNYKGSSEEDVRRKIELVNRISAGLAEQTTAHLFGGKHKIISEIISIERIDEPSDWPTTEEDGSTILDLN